VLTVISALSPSDLVPDFIPGIGLLDDLIVIPLGIALALRFMPQDVWDEYRKKALAGFAEVNLASFEGVLLILFILLRLWRSSSSVSRRSSSDFFSCSSWTCTPLQTPSTGGRFSSRPGLGSC